MPTTPPTLTVEFATNINVYGDSTKENLKGSLVVDKSVINAFSSESSARMSLAASASDVAFGLQGMSAGKLVLLQSDSPFSFKINGGSAITLTPRTNTDDSSVVPACAMLMSDAITGLTLSNPDSANPIVVDVVVAG